jgi:hypothetical protein
MKVGLAIRQLLVDDTPVQALVSGRIYPELAAEGAQAPYVVYSVMSNAPQDTKNGTPIDEANVEIISVARSYGAANDLADKVRAALDRANVSVAVGEGTVMVQSIQYTNEITQVSEDRQYYAAVQDYTIRIKRS